MEKPEWKKNIILFVTTHGLITKESEEASVGTFNVPDDIKIIRASVSVPGECNIVSEDDVNGYVKIINSHIKGLTSNRESTQNNATKTVMTNVKKLGKSELQGLETQVKYLKNKKELEDDEKETIRTHSGFIYNYEKGFNVDVFNSGQEMLNKMYMRHNIESTKNDWVIKIMNIKGQPDLLSFLKRQTRTGTSKITLKEIVNFLKDKGVKNVIILDFSCASIQTSEYYDYSNRTIRSERRNIKKKSLGGNNSRKVITYKNKKNKSKKNYK